MNPKEYWEKAGRLRKRIRRKENEVIVIYLRLPLLTLIKWKLLYAR